MYKRQLFAVLILYLFLKDLRPTLITLCSIPVSVIFAVVLMYFSGVTINMISLSGLAVAVGMLVDNSVVVIENIYRLRSKGATVIQAAVSGAAQVVGAITASTLTTVCVFLPIVFVEGITKQLFTDLALTMTYSLLALSLIHISTKPITRRWMTACKRGPGCTCAACCPTAASTPIFSICTPCWSWPAARGWTGCISTPFWTDVTCPPPAARALWRTAPRPAAVWG